MRTRPAPRARPCLLLPAVGGASTPVNDAVEVDAAAGDADDAVGAVGFSVGFDDAHAPTDPSRCAAARRVVAGRRGDGVGARGERRDRRREFAAVGRRARIARGARAVANLGVQVMPGLAATGTFDARVGADWVAPGRTAGRPGRRAVGADGREHDDGLEAPRDIGSDRRRRVRGDRAARRRSNSRRRHESWFDGCRVDVRDVVAVAGDDGSSRRVAVADVRGARRACSRWGAAAPIAPSAARAMALAARDGGVTSARARAQLAWSVLPVVHVGLEGAARPGVTSREGLGGEVSMGQTGYAQVAGFDPSTTSRAWPPRARGRPASRCFGVSAPAPGAALRLMLRSRKPRGGVDGATASSARAKRRARLPPRPSWCALEHRRALRWWRGRDPSGWFEAAARKMLSEQRSSGSDFSLAGLTLVAAAPAAQIAASSKDTAVSASAASSSQSASLVEHPGRRRESRHRAARARRLRSVHATHAARWRNYGDR